MSYPRTPTTTTSAATTTPNATPNEPYDASPATPTDSATPSASIPSKPHSSPKRCFSHRHFRRSHQAQKQPSWVAGWPKVADDPLVSPAHQPTTHPNGI